MLIRFIFWMIVAFVLVKIAGEIIRYIRKLLIPNQHIKNSIQQQRAEKYNNIEDVPYEEIPDKKNNLHGDS